MAFSNKRGQAIFDLTILVIIIFVLALAAIFGGFIYSELNDEIQNDTDFSNTAKSTAQNIDDNYVATFDNIIFIAVVLLWLGLIITSFFIDSHPIFFIITIVFMVLVFIAGMAISNAYEEISEDAELNSYANNFSKTNFIFDNFLIILIVIGFTTALALYAKSGGSL